MWLPPGRDEFSGTLGLVKGICAFPPWLERFERGAGGGRAKVGGKLLDLVGRKSAASAGFPFLLEECLDRSPIEKKIDSSSPATRTQHAKCAIHAHVIFRDCCRRDQPAEDFELSLDWSTDRIHFVDYRFMERLSFSHFPPPGFRGAFQGSFITNVIARQKPKSSIFMEVGGIEPPSESSSQ